MPSKKLETEHTLLYKYNKAKYGSEKLNQKSAKWRKANPEKVKLILEKSRKNNPERNLLNKARANAKRLGVEFSLERNDIVIPTYCPLLENKIDPWGHRDYCPSIDRIDSSKGYTKDNIHVISWKANRMKNTATLDELEKFCRNGLNYWRDIVNYG